MSYEGRCAGCNAVSGSAAFGCKSKRNGVKLPPREKRGMDFAFESAVNDRLCNACDLTNRRRLEKGLKQPRKREDEHDDSLDDEEEREGAETRALFFFFVLMSEGDVRWVSGIRHECTAAACANRAR